MIEIREETKNDYDEIRLVNNIAFGQTTEGMIVDKLRDSSKEILSLVAAKNDKIIGHILFSPAHIDTNSETIKGIALGPMSVLPEFQNKGIGTMLVKEGLRLIKEMSYPFVVVLGHKKYYPRFGFEPASIYNLKCPWEGVPDEAFMVLLFNDAAIKNINGTIKYRDEFNEAVRHHPQIRMLNKYY